MHTQQFTNKQISSLVAVTLFGVLLSVSFHIPLVIGFTPGFLYLILLVKRKGATFKEIIEVCKKGIGKTKTVILILLLVSFVLPSWYMSGTIEQLVSISLQIITPEHFYLLSFVIAMVFSMILGTSVGTLSAVGIPIITTALSINLSPEIVAGALISGAFVGDRTSPFSSAHQLLSHTVEVPIRKQFKALFFTTIAAILIGIVFYSFLDYHQSDTKIHNLLDFSWDQVSFIAFLPPFILILLVLFRKGIISAFLSSITVAIMIALLNEVSFMELNYGLLFGVEGMGGGLANMYLLLLFLALAGAYNGLLEEYRIIQPMVDGWFKDSKTVVEDTLKTIVAAFGISLIAANQTLPIILTGRTLLPHWLKNQSKDDFARVMADSAMLFPGMIPWSVLAIMCSTVLGVPIMSYLPYAIFLWVLPILTVILSIFSQRKTIKTNKYNISNVS